METDAFRKIGFTEGETKVYFALLGEGPCTTGLLAKSTKMQKSAIYFCLESLISKGMASYMLKNNVKYFSAEAPEKTLEYLEKKQEEIEADKKEVQKILPDLIKMQKAGEKEAPRARLFEGWEGAKSAFSDVFKTCKKGDEFLALGVSMNKEVHERFRRFMLGFHSERSRKGIGARFLMNRELEATVGRDRQKEKNSRVKYLNSKSPLPTVNLYGKKVMLAMWSENPVILIVEDERMHDSLVNYFNLVWNGKNK